MGLKICFVREPATDAASPQHIDLSAGADWASVGADREERAVPCRSHPRQPAGVTTTSREGDEGATCASTP